MPRHYLSEVLLQKGTHPLSTVVTKSPVIELVVNVGECDVNTPSGTEGPQKCLPSFCSLLLMQMDRSFSS